ncbi:MAG: R3H domain-containing nucleic acid-binding protein [Verrucomicrobiota bacterium]
MSLSIPHNPEMSPRELLECMLGHLGFIFQVEEIQRGEHLILNIQTRDSRKLIGRDGHVLEEMQYLLNRLISGKDDHSSRVMIDVEGYRQKEQQLLIERAKALAERALKEQETQMLPSMNAFERFLVHQEFKDHPQIKSRSIETQGKLKQIALELRNSK